MVILVMNENGSERLNAAGHDFAAKVALHGLHKRVVEQRLLRRPQAGR